MLVPFRSEASINNLANNLRKALGFTELQKIDFMTLITKLKVRYDTIDYRRVPDEEMNGIEAQWDSDKKLIYISESVFCSANRGEPRALMTIAHEVGHMILGHKGRLNRGPISERDLGFGSTGRAEFQAKIFASALLVPLHPKVIQMTEDQIENEFGVSKQAASIRAEQLKKLI